MLEVGVNLLAQFVHELIKAQVDLRLNFIVQKLLLEHGESVMSTVIIQVQGVENAPEDEEQGLDFKLKVKYNKILLHVGRVFGLQDVVCQDPWHGHFDWELNSLSHRHLQIELPIP